MKDNEPKTNVTHGASLQELCSLEFLFVTGKGGVGKSTTAALLGLKAAALGRSVLVVHPEGSQPHDGLWGDTLHSSPTEVAPGVDVISISAELSMREYASTILHSKALVNALFHSKVARGFLTGMPGLSDWAILGKAWSFTRSGHSTLPGQKTYDLVIVDAPASGDGSKMLGVPQVILDLSPTGRMKTDAEACLAMLKDGTRSRVLLVALAEELVVTETEENLELIQNQLGLPLGPIVVNQLLDSRFSSEDRQALKNLPQEPTRTTSEQTTSEPAIGELLLCKRLAQERIAREELQISHLQRLKRAGLPLLQIARVEEALSGVQALKKLEITLADGH